jgi:endonuclease-3 related protein
MVEARISNNAVKKRLMAIYRVLFRAYGPQHWWPADTPFEVMVGAVLTQNTAWANVEKAIANLKRERLLTTPLRMNSVAPEKLASLIRPSGHYNVKTKRLRNLLSYINTQYSGSLTRMFATDSAVVRQQMLQVNGIGPETADSILLYAGKKPFFVVDAYTKRIFSRQGLIKGNADYRSVQDLFMDNLPHDARFFNEYHALIVKIGKEYCKKTRPLCHGCPFYQKRVPVSNFRPKVREK